ncbi:MAG: DUF523 domain-containing protein [Clostridiales Family XIII bacterium]|jgi:uncharacterized protein YbbK (DUF523 family)|nr:DUF523 domain-containing protein [Clostridiales Family XIII bacterium]
MKKILVSECLYGGRHVRYDGAGAACTDGIFLKWKAEGRLVPVCPEVCGGLPVPREPAQRRDGRVVTERGRDVTAQFRKGAEEALRLAKEHSVVCAIMKEGSPSCGVHAIYDGSFTGKKTAGEGLATQLLRGAGHTVFSESEIAAAKRAIDDD